MSWTPATELTCSRSRPHLVNRYSPVQNNEYPEAKFLYEIQTKSLRRFPPFYSQSPLQLCLEIYISSNSRNLLQFLEFSSLVQFLYTVKEKGGKPNRKPYSLPYGLGNPYRNLKSENSQDYAQKPQRNCTFMNSASGLQFIELTWSTGRTE
jgi:hypothetical protein